MRKKLYLFPLVLVAVCISFASCLNNDDDDEEDIDQEWKSLNDSRFAQISTDPDYGILTSQTGNGSIYWKKSTKITDSDASLSIRVTPGGKPEFTDTVVVRYEGWYLDKDGKEVIFDSTEGISVKSELAYYHGISATKDPNKKPIQMPVNNVIDGWITLLQDMTVGEERVVVIPQILGYGSAGSTYQPVSGYSYQLIPGYTTLWFRIKLFKIIPMKGLKN